jgi:hypothetical protein
MNRVALILAAAGLVAGAVSAGPLKIDRTLTSVP